MLYAALRPVLTASLSESSIIIATHSIIIPPASANPDFSDQFGVPPSTPPPASPSISSWDNYGPEQEIQLCEVKVTVYNTLGSSGLIVLSGTIAILMSIGPRDRNEAFTTSISTGHFIVTSQ
jgi:hypothetical protein